MKTFTLITFFLCLQLTALAANEQGFTENKGQWPDEVRFLYQQNGMNAWITDRGMVYDFRKINVLPGAFAHDQRKDEESVPKFSIEGHVVRMNLAQGSAPSKVLREQELGHLQNYFLGNDQEKWATDVKTYEEVTLKDVYAGVDIRYYQDKGSLRYDFIVHPGIDPQQIAWVIDGAGSSIGEDGQLIMHTTIGGMEQAELNTYQVKQGNSNEVQSSFDLTKNVLSFRIGEYDTTLPLIIDPITYVTDLGSVNDYDEFYRILLDGNGTKWVYGETQSVSFPTTLGAYSNTSAGGIDLVISRIDAAGSGLIFSTYIGGSGEEELFVGKTTVLSNDGGLVFTGTTQSTDFPTVIGAFDNSHNGDKDAIIAKINGTGNSLLFSTYFGGTDRDYGGCVDLDANENVYLMGWTNASGNTYPISGGAYDQTANGGGDLAVTKFNSTCSTVEFSTLFGGNDYDDGYGMELDNAGNVVVLGYTRSMDLPASAGHQTTFGGGLEDIYAFKLNSTGSSLIACTYLGGTDIDRAYGFDMNADGNFVLSGNSMSTDFPIQDGYAIHRGGFDAVIATLSSDLSTLVFSTYYGGGGDDYGFGIDVDANNSIYVCGTTYSSDLFLINPDQGTTGSDNDGFVIRYRPDSTWILTSSYFGGNGPEELRSVSCDDVGGAFFTGLTGSDDLSITSTLFSDGIVNSIEGLVLGMDMCHTNFSSATVAGPVCVNSEGTLMAEGGQSYSWTGPNGFTSGQQNPVFTATAQHAGTYTVTVTDLGCTSTSQVVLVVDPALGTSIIGPSYVDPFTPTSFVVAQNLGSTYTWTVTNGTLISGQGTNSVSITFPTEGTATVTVTEVNGSCSETTSVTITVGCATLPDPPTVSGATTVDENTSETYSVPSQSGYSYSWIVSGGTIVSGLGTNSITVQWGAAGTGTVSISWGDANGCESDPANTSVTINAGTPPIEWTVIASDVTGDGASTDLMDGTLLEYLYDPTTDSLFFRATVASMSAANTQAVGMNVHLYFGDGGTTFDFWGNDNNVNTNPNGWHRMLTTWVTGTPPSNYSGTIGIADANGVAANDFTNLSQNNISVRVDQTAKTITMGLLSVDAIPSSADPYAVTVAAAVGSNEFWNDDIYLPGSIISVGISSFDDEASSSALIIYPNPNSGQFYMDLTHTDFTAAAQINIFDPTGRLVYSSIAQGAQPKISLEAVSNGLYLVQVREKELVRTSRISVVN